MGLDRTGCSIKKFQHRHGVGERKATMPKERDEYAIQGRIMTEKYGALPCQHLYKWLTFVIPKGFREFASILDSVLEDLESRDAFIRFMEDPIETTKETLLRCVGFADTPLGSCRSNPKEDSE